MIMKLEEDNFPNFIAFLEIQKDFMGLLYSMSNYYMTAYSKLVDV